ncbi:MAG: hypothetical protein ACR2RV_06690, partial [Verrucomicrobiales bacterium]
MTFSRLLRVGLPLLALCLLWLISRPQPAPETGLSGQANLAPEPAIQADQRTLPQPARAIEGFGEWMEDYRSSPDTVSLERGLAFAESRRVAMGRLIEENPQRALELAVPASARAGLP